MSAEVRNSESDRSAEPDINVLASFVKPSTHFGGFAFDRATTFKDLLLHCEWSTMYNNKHKTTRVYYGASVVTIVTTCCWDHSRKLIGFGTAGGLIVNGLFSSRNPKDYPIHFFFLVESPGEAILCREAFILLLHLPTLVQC
ncbi:hypothetical protein CBL_01962 [Carabus blaptoides fortunei]